MLFLVGGLIGLTTAGCSSTSPRFRSNAAAPSATTKTAQQPRFATKVRQEETAEDDRKVNIEEVKERFSREDASRSGSIDRKKVMTEVMSLLGTPYAFGNSTSDGMDCSAFTSRIYEKAIRHPLPRSTAEQYRSGNTVRGGRLRFGDLLFFNTTGETPSHVGIFLGDDLFAHASVSWGVTISSLQSSYYNKRYIGARRILD